MKIEVLDPQVLVYMVHDFLLEAECKSIIASSESLGYTPAPFTTSPSAGIAPEIRSNTRVMMDDHHLANGLWNRLRPYIPQHAHDWDDEQCEAVGLNERFRYFRYDKGQRFARHYDGTFHRPSGEASLLTLMVYLNDGFWGGETRFFSDTNSMRFSVRPRQGTALIFLHNQLHEGSPVLDGRKYILRSDIMYRRKNAGEMPLSPYEVSSERLGALALR